MLELDCSEVSERMLVERYLEDALRQDEVEALESHYLVCPRCSESLRLAIGVRAALIRDIGSEPTRREGAFAVQGTERTSRRNVVGVATLAIAAVLATLVLARPSDLSQGAMPVHRDEAVETAVEVVPEDPVGRVQTPSEFRWSALESADRYRVTLYDAAGAVVWETETREARARLPEGTTLVPGRSYLWGVAARVDWNRWVPSDLVEFVVLQR